MAGTQLNPLSMFAEAVRQGVDNYVATQKVLLDLAANQSQALTEAMKNNFGMAGWAPAMADLAGQGAQAFLASQKTMLDLALQQNLTSLNAMKGAASNPAAQSILDMLAQGGQSYVEMQKRFLDMAAQQTDMATKAAKEGRPAGGAMPLEQIAEMSKQATQAWVDSQKNVLDMVQQHTAAMADRAKTAAQPADAASTGAPANDFATLARQSYEQYMETQKRFLETASQQMAETTRMWQTGAAYRPPVTLQDLARQGVDAWVTTQRAMLDLTFKAITPRS
ncbi:MAG: hypothetical protein ABI823_19945 [Bryobacteraceae bacterium]